MLDGIDNNHKTGLFTVVIPSADAIETVSVSTSNKVNGRTNAELRVDGFNATNSPHFNNPNTQLGSTTFGQVTSAFGERFIRFGARLTF